jgi:hypothetical protein
VVRDHPDPPFPFEDQTIPGGLAQLGEHLLCKQGVVGSIPSSSTKTLFALHTNTQAASQEASLVLSPGLPGANRLFFNNS